MSRDKLAKSLQRRLIADVFELSFWQDDQIAITSETLTDGKITVEVNSTDVKGGRGNFKIATLHSGRDITIECNDPCFDYNILALNLGQDVITGKGIGYCMTRKYKVKNKKIVLEEIPYNASEVVMYYKGELLEPVTDYEISSTDNITVTFSKPEVEDEQYVTVRPYRFETDDDSEIISINSNTYAKGGKLVLETLEKNTNEESVARIQYVFPSAQPDGNFEVDTQSEVQASSTPLKFTVNKP